MTGLPPPASQKQDMYEAAAFWDARLRSPTCTADDREAFAAWRSLSPDHAAAFERLQTGLRSLQVAAVADPQLRAVHDRARVMAGVHTRRRQLTAGLIAAALVGVAGLGAYHFVASPAAPQSVYRTTAGERSTVRLADGSVVMLNSKTELRVAYRKKARNVTLVAGEAVFDVAKDAKRPFTVVAGRRGVTAVGTAFGVRVDPQGLRVTMIEGKVKVEPRGAWKQRPAQQILVAGQRMTAGANALEVRVDRADLAKDTGWLDGKLIFEGETLANAVDEINRYTDKPVRIGDESLARLSVSGMFRTTQPGKFVDALTTYYPVQARVLPSGETVLYRR